MKHKRWGIAVGCLVFFASPGLPSHPLGPSLDPSCPNQNTHTQTKQQPAQPPPPRPTTPAARTSSTRKRKRRRTKARTQTRSRRRRRTRTKGKWKEFRQFTLKVMSKPEGQAPPLLPKCFCSGRALGGGRRTRGKRDQRTRGPADPSTRGPENRKKLEALQQSGNHALALTWLLHLITSGLHEAQGTQSWQMIWLAKRHKTSKFPLLGARI